ncbi:MAG: TlpA family protein disulfide reductase [Acidobacteriota bacterium]|nr:TlpA family protein disulfide reductase [Acidobacteriota bacterium]
MDEEIKDPAPPTDNTEKAKADARGRKIKIIAACIVTAAVIICLYFVNRYWIAPVAANQARPVADANVKYPMAPSFSVTGLDGQKISLDDYRGKVVILDFWATWCGPCRMEIPGFVQLQQKYGPQGFQMIGISMDDGPAPVRQFYSDFHMNYPVAMGSQKLSELYGGIIGLPTTFVIGRDGRIYDKIPGAVDRGLFDTEIQTLLAAPSSQEVKDFKPVTGSGQVELETPAEVNSEVPGIDLTKLSKAQVAQYKAILSKQNCTCGCAYNLLQCRINDSLCDVSRKAAKEQLQKLEHANPRI